MAILQSVVWHAARPRWLCNEQYTVYGTAGLAYGNLTANLAGLEESKTLVGWTGGLGMEVGFTPNWTAKVEYLYMDLGSRSFSVTGTENGLQSSYLRFGVNYHF